MRSILIWGSLIASLVGGVAPRIATAQIFPLVDPCCYSCRQQHCTCATVQPVATIQPVTTVQPVVETRYRQEQVVTYRDVKQTAVQQQAVVETVPVTTVQNVTVDEGGYQMVWVSKPVTKQVAHTELQTRVSHRTVPVEVTQRVAEVGTRLVPERSVRYVTQQTPMIVGGAAAAPIVATGTFVTPTIPISTQIGPTTMVPTVTPGAVSVTPTTPSAASLVPDSGYDDTATQWTTISSKSSQPTASDAYNGSAGNAVSATRKLFVPAPSAAAVWQSQVSRK